MSWFKKIRNALGKTSNTITSSITQIFTKSRLNNETLDELTDLLITTDIGITVTNQIIQGLKRDKFDKDIDINEIKQYIADHIASILSPRTGTLNITHQPHVILVCGVNGSGKTTTIGKIASQFKAKDKSVVLAACDTFRAAADLQLRVWADRLNIPLIGGDINSDPASVAYKALDYAKSNNTDVLIIDTAGRLQNKTGLMEELAKIIRVLKKLDADCPHDTLLVLDACVGQNALSQVEIFKQIVNINGLIITKLDGTARGGILVAIAQKYDIPVYLIGVGEAIDDLDQFEPIQFSKSLVGVE